MLGLRRYFQGFTLSQKIGRALIFTTFSSLLIWSAAIMSYELSASRHRLMEYVDTLGRIVGSNSTGALAFGDTAAADSILANLRFESGIMAARLYNLKGDPFATFVRNGIEETTLPKKSESDRTWTERHRVRIFRTIHYRADIVGSIYLESDMSRVYQRLGNYIKIMVGLLVVVIPFIALFSKIFQKLILEPIRALDALAHRITTEKKYGLRAEVKARDEIGRLTETFNRMLDSIEERDQKLVTQSEELRRSNKELEQFAYVSSHDLQEPLRKIITYSQMIEEQEKGRVRPETERYIANVVSAAARMRALISNLLTYSRLSRRKTTVDKVDVQQVVNGVLSDMETVIAENKIQITMEPLPTIQATEVELQQLFQNLIANAIKFRGAENPIIRISCRRDGSVWVFSVHDNGIGLDPKYGTQIFEVFQRLHGRDEYPGTGIGLAICKKIVEQNGGRIWVESEPGQGASFYFTWPAL